MAGGINKSGGDDLSPMAEINITPMVDVMLVLLIIFMVAAPMLESGIAVELPKASAKALPPSEEIVTLNITAQKEYFLNKKQIAVTSLKEEIQTFFAKRKDKQIFIRADHVLPYGEVARAMSEIKLAGIHKIGLVTLPPGKQ